MADAAEYTKTLDPHDPHPNPLPIFLALCVCTALSWIADKTYGWGIINSKKVIAVLVLAIAVAKAQFVMRYFMHLKFEGRWKYVLLLPTAILACGLPLALAPDIALHYYTPERDAAIAVDFGHHAGAEPVQENPAPSELGADSPVPAHELRPGDVDASGAGEGGDVE